MNDLNKFSDSELLVELQKLVSEERKLTTQILWHLKEVENRKLFLAQGYSSLFDYCVRVLSYSESGAVRRISSMRLLRDIPQVEEAIDSGKLNLSKLAQAQQFFNQEKKMGKTLDADEKKTILSQLETKSTRECETFFASLSPESPPKDRERVLTETLTEIKFVANATLMKKLNRFKELNSHVQQNPSYQELFEYLVDFALKEKDPLSEKQLKEGIFKKNSLPNQGLSPNEGIDLAQTHTSAHHPSTPHHSNNSSNHHPRMIPTALKRLIWSRDQGKCTFKSETTGKICGSQFQVQIDHILPVGRGGKSTEDNLRLVCREHNIFLAKQVFGESYMKKYAS